METPEEPLVPEGNWVPDIRLPEFRGIVLGASLILLAYALGWLLRLYLAAPLASAVEHGAVPDNVAAMTLVNGVVSTLTYVLPYLIGIVMLWVAFVRGELRDRYLWSGLMVVSATELVPIFALLGPNDWHGRIASISGVFVYQSLAVGTIAYLALHFAMRAGRRKQLGTLALAVLAVMYFLVVFLGYRSILTAACTLLVSLGFWAIGVWIAQRVGFDVYAVDEA